MLQTLHYGHNITEITLWTQHYGNYIMDIMTE